MYFRVEQLIVLLPICVMMSLDKNWNVATTERVSGQEDSTAMFGRPISYSRHTLFRYRRCHAVGMSKSTYIDILTERGLLRYRGTRGGQAARARREARLRSKPEANRSVEKPELTSISDQIGLMAGNNNIPVIISRQESYDQRSHQSNFSLADRISTLVYPLWPSQLFTDRCFLNDRYQHCTFLTLRLWLKLMQLISWQQILLVIILILDSLLKLT